MARRKRSHGPSRSTFAGERERRRPTLARGWREEAARSSESWAAVLRSWVMWAETIAGRDVGPFATRVSVLRWAGLTIVALPGEIFAATGIAIRDAIAGPSMTAGYAESNPGYIPPADEYPHGGYEVDEAHRYYGMPAPFAPGSAERLAQRRARTRAAEGMTMKTEGASMQRRTFLATAASAAALGRSAWAETPRRGGTLNMILQPEPAILNLAINQQTPVAMVCGKVNQSLLSYDFDLSPKPCLAKSWEISPDGLTYTFHLFDNVQWHDGQPFTSEDVVWNHTDFLPAVHSRARIVATHVESVTAPDKSTVVFRLKTPFTAFIKTFEMNSAPLYPKHIYAGTDYHRNPSNLKPIGTGPFKFAEWQSGNFIRLVRHDAYHMTGQPYLDQIILRIIPDAQSRLIAIQGGQVDVASWVDIDYVLLPQLRNDKKLTITGKGYEFASPITWLEINNRVKPFDDKRVRQAVLTALDRQFIVRAIFAGQCRVANGPIASVTTDYDPNVLKRPYDPEGRRGAARCRRTEARRRRHPVPHQAPAASLRRDLGAPCRILPTGARENRHRHHHGEHRCGRVGAARRELGLRSDGERAQPVWRCRARRRAQLRLQQHPQGRLRDEHRGIRQSACRRTVRGGRGGARSREAARDVCRDAAHRHRRGPRRLDRGDDLSDRALRARTRRGDHRGRHGGQSRRRLALGVSA